MNARSLTLGSLKAILALSALCVQVFTDAVDATAAPLSIPSVPLAATLNAKPMTMLIAGRDHRLFYEAYNDASDVNGDGVLDLRFNPSIEYFGLFDTDVCYRYNGNANANDNGTTKNAEQFEPVSPASTDGLRRCVGSNQGTLWSGN